MHHVMVGLLCCLADAPSLPAGAAADGSADRTAIFQDNPRLKARISLTLRDWPLDDVLSTTDGKVQAGLRPGGTSRTTG